MKPNEGRTTTKEAEQIWKKHVTEISTDISRKIIHITKQNYDKRQRKPTIKC